MPMFTYQNGVLHAEQVSLAALASQHGTPLYVYSRTALEQHFNAYTKALGEWPHLVCYAVKANSNLAVLNVLAQQGAGFDIVSLGELERVLAAGGDPKKVVFSGVGKQAHEMARALEVGVYCFNVESEAELERLSAVATERGQVAHVSLRVNPDVDAQTHPYISTGLKDNKFGVDINDAPRVYAKAASLPGLEVKGVDCHIGSQLTEIRPFLDALDRLLVLIDTLAEQGITIEHLDLGGGLGVQYRDETPASAEEYIAAVKARLGERRFKLIFEPGRSVAANAGVFLTRVEYLKLNDHKNFAIIDGAMNDLIRPALYSAWQDIKPVVENSDAPLRTYDLVGPVCETGDFLGKNRELALSEGDLLAVMSAGAYGFVMASNYNTRGRAAEIMVDGTQAHVVRERETIASLYAGESVLPAN
ncbi:MULTISPECIES: diaminopimelate decarboxylase [Oceanospirillaceae]|jgi:diaminopimelate decarboxylase|uniref:Diaminopimelate decarboxylase n=1 Tax=Thalassolituus hydrocarboniclasticus TaxID=2742796 RepID=A0ABY6AFS4_9GAMM|nr:MULTISPECIES: diaminopimelate decarboxylase [Thalassolituus]MBU2039752.1 diaminopimelate decarboxylase [Gammaproteobacteria bacterium]MCA6058782.1 diaminopimelate decarboxylase [Thalassolituus sp. ST750PaO-4]MCB2386025.1 diaminopimelate decarboxylase [Thalassolituus alkanivorans]MCB2422652.1 diaminopimelate decarboxylase [Thalassolituus alkanivorans]TVV44851.1 diaminopimelate decarboxylase [Thalassolituus sp. C2-1]